MPLRPVQVALELRPQARVDVIDVRERIASLHPGALDQYPRCLYYSFHTTAGYLDQSLATRLDRCREGIGSYVEVFRACFPAGAGYRHDQLERRRDLSRADRRVEPRNADSHLAFIAAGLRSCVSYRNRRARPVSFIDLDGVFGGRPRRRLTSVVGYTAEAVVARRRIAIPVSGHPVDSVNLKEARLGLYDELADLVERHGVNKGRIRLELAPSDHHAGLTVNEYETLLMRHDLAEVMRDPVRFVTEKGRHMLADPRAIPVKTLGYAKYDLVRAFNQFIDTFGLSESLIERILARAIALPAARFLRMKRSVSLLVSDADRDGKPAIVEGTYQSPILVQWRGAPQRVRLLDVTLTRFR